MWERATPIAFRDGEPVVEAESSFLPQDAERLIGMLAAGLNDKSIAADLGISARTLDRRIVDLMKSLDARTRFQAGWLAALRTRR